MAYVIPLNVPTGEVDLWGEPKAARATLTSHSIYSRYGTPALDVGDKIDYGPSEIVPRFGRTAANLVVAALTMRINRGQLALTDLSHPLDDAHPDDQAAAEAHQWEGIRRFLRQWPEGPQL